MSSFRYVPSAEVDARHRAARINPSRTVSRGNAPPVIRNVKAVLDLGTTRYMPFRRRTYCVPAVSYETGLGLLDLFTSCRTAQFLIGAGQGDDKVYQGYKRDIRRLAKALWRHAVPMGRTLRFMKRVGIMQNPFRHATEAELMDLCDFFLRGRTKSDVQFSSEQSTLP